MSSVTKVCPKCKIEKDVSEFWYGKRKRSRCLTCEKQDQQQYRNENRDTENNRKRRFAINNPEKVKAYHSNYYAENRERQKENVQRWIKNNPEKWKNNIRKSILKRKYGITPDDYDRMFRKQGGVCAVCGKPPGKSRLSVDHNHKTGKVRSLLCVSCNAALGYAYENPSILERLIEYLKGHS